MKSIVSTQYLQHTHITDILYLITQQLCFAFFLGLSLNNIIYSQGSERNRQLRKTLFTRNGRLTVRLFDAFFWRAVLVSLIHFCSTCQSIWVLKPCISDTSTEQSCVLRKLFEALIWASLSFGLSRLRILLWIFHSSMAHMLLMIPSGPSYRLHPKFRYPAWSGIFSDDPFDPLYKASDHDMLNSPSLSYRGENHYVNRRLWFIGSLRTDFCRITAKWQCKHQACPDCSHPPSSQYRACREPQRYTAPTL